MTELKLFKNKVKKRTEEWVDREDTTFTVKATHLPGTLPYVLAEEIERLSTECSKKDGALKLIHWMMGDEAVPEAIRNEVCDVCNDAVSAKQEEKS